MADCRSACGRAILGGLAAGGIAVMSLVGALTVWGVLAENPFDNAARMAAGAGLTSIVIGLALEGPAAMREWPSEGKVGPQHSART